VTRTIRLAAEAGIDVHIIARPRTSPARDGSPTSAP